DLAFLKIEPTTGEFTYEIKNDVVEIRQDNKVVGFNIFNASKVSNITGKGHIKLDENLIHDLQKAINNAGFTFELNADLSPKFVVGYVETKDKH
ncbi:DUF4479 domain-containing protein, partial [Mesorhizobium sp. M8A.F.Ca.ET.173.01.1.1]